MVMCMYSIFLAFVKFWAGFKKCFDLLYYFFSYYLAQVALKSRYARASNPSPLCQDCAEMIFCGPKEIAVNQNHWELLEMSP